jgi:hypothetical protein
VHQPCWEAFCLFTDVILLAKGGLTAYCGAQDGLQVRRWLACASHA